MTGIQPGGIAGKRPARPADAIVTSPGKEADAHSSHDGRCRRGRARRRIAVRARHGCGGDPDRRRAARHAVARLRRGAGAAIRGRRSRRKGYDDPPRKRLLEPHRGQCAARRVRSGQRHLCGMGLYGRRNRLPEEEIHRHPGGHGRSAPGLDRGRAARGLCPGHRVFHARPGASSRSRRSQDRHGALFQPGAHLRRQDPGIDGFQPPDIAGNAAAMSFRSAPRRSPR